MGLRDLGIGKVGCILIEEKVALRRINDER